MIFLGICAIGWILWWMEEKSLAKRGLSEDFVKKSGEHIIESHTGIHRRRK